MPLAAYVPPPGSATARAIAYLSAHCPPDGEASSAELAEAIGVDVNAISAFLSSAMHHRLILRETRERKAYWRLPAVPTSQADLPAQSPPAAAKTADDERDDAPVAPAAAAERFGGMLRQLWRPDAQDADSESSLDEPPMPVPNSAPLPPVNGLGWKAPRRVHVPIFGRDAAQENTTSGFEPAALVDACIGADPGLELIGARFDGNALVTTIRTANDETVRQLREHIVPSQDPDLDIVDARFDPDFQEVARAPSSIGPCRAGFSEVVHFGPPDPDTPQKGAESAQAPISCGRDDATPNDGVVPQETVPSPAPPTLPLHVGAAFNCALWSNGRFQIHTSDGEGVLLTAKDTRLLLRYVSDVLSTRVRVEA